MYDGSYASDRDLHVTGLCMRAVFITAKSVAAYRVAVVALHGRMLISHSLT